MEFRFLRTNNDYYSVGMVTPMVLHICQSTYYVQSYDEANRDDNPMKKTLCILFNQHCCRLEFLQREKRVV